MLSSGRLACNEFPANRQLRCGELPINKNGLSVRINDGKWSPYLGLPSASARADMETFMAGNQATKSNNDV
jgi:hypothetical protein